MPSLAMNEITQISMSCQQKTEFSIKLHKLLKNFSVYLLIPFSGINFIDFSFLRFRNMHLIKNDDAC